VPAAGRSGHILDDVVILIEINFQVK